MKRAVCVFAILAMIPAAAGAQEAADRRVAEQKLTFIHWWTSPSEAAALGALVTLFKQKYPDVGVAPVVSPTGGNLRSLFPMIKRLQLEKKTPDAVQMFAGYAAEIFVKDDLLSPLDDLWAKDNLESVIPPVIRELSRFNGHYYSVPVNVHRTNLIWYNKALLDKYSIDPDTLTTWEAFFAAADTLRAGGVKTPIQMGVTWTQTAAFEGIVASGGIAAYQDWINGKMASPDDPRLIKAFVTIDKYMSYSNKDRDETQWDVAIRRVMSGDGAFCLMGDWADGEFRAAHLKYGKDYGALVIPGTKGIFGLGVDTFMRPRGIVDPTNANRWLSLVASREGQDAFNLEKGSIPARTDTDLTRYDPYQRQAISELKAARHLYPSISSAVPEAFKAQVGGVLNVLVIDHDAEKAARTMAAHTQRMVYTHNWSLK
jgi:glucose/mannose transport system substrate-binding protein